MGAPGARQWTRGGRWTGPATSSARGASSWSRYRQLVMTAGDDSWQMMTAGIMLMTGGRERERLQRGRHPQGCAQARGQPRDRGHAQGPQVSLDTGTFYKDFPPTLLMTLDCLTSLLTLLYVSFRLCSSETWIDSCSMNFHSMYVNIHTFFLSMYVNMNRCKFDEFSSYLLLTPSDCARSILNNISTM